MRQIRRHTSTPFPRIFLKNPARWAEPPGQARTRSPSQFPGHTAIGTKALGLLFLRRKVASRAISKFESYAGHSGAPRSGEPGIHNRRPRAMDSGLATFGGAPE